MEKERQIWNESRTRDLQIVDEILCPQLRQHLSVSVPTGGMSRRELVAVLLAWIGGYELEDWIGDVPLERRPAAPLRIANHDAIPGNAGRAEELRRPAAAGPPHGIRGGV